MLRRITHAAIFANILILIEINALIHYKFQSEASREFVYWNRKIKVNNRFKLNDEYKFNFRSVV